MKRKLTYQHFLTALRYLNYLFKSGFRNGHRVHSPFVYDFCREVLFSKKEDSELVLIANIRNALLKSSEILETGNFGSGSDVFNATNRDVADLVRNSSVRPKFGKLLFRISQYYRPDLIVELGTSVGISSLYLAKGSPGSKLITFEGSPALGTFAAKLFTNKGIKNIHVISGNFDDQLEKYLADTPSPTLVFIDGNHAYEPTLKYYHFFSQRMDRGIIILDDINWSEGMLKAWREITNDNKARACIDLFFMGIVIIDPFVTPGKYKIRY